MQVSSEAMMWAYTIAINDILHTVYCFNISSFHVLNLIVVILSIYDLTHNAVHLYIWNKYNNIM